MAREKIKKIPQLTGQEAARYRRIVEALAAKDASEEEIRQEYREYLPDKPLGRAICESYQKEELTLLLKDCADKLGHAPAMHEVFSLYRSYIKRRFGTWPKALREAGLRYGLNGSRSEVEWRRMLQEEPEIGIALVRLTEQRRTLGYPPARKEAREGALLKQRFGDWNTALQAAQELDAWLEENPTPLTPSAAGEPGRLTALAEGLGRSPLLIELPEEERIALRLRYGSWKEALRAAGLSELSSEEGDRARWEYRQRKQAGSCRLYLIREPTDEQIQLLEELDGLCGKFGRVPIREEVPGPLWEGLLREFSSWRNALFQLQKAPLSESERKAVRNSNREK